MNPTRMLFQRPIYANIDIGTYRTGTKARISRIGSSPVRARLKSGPRLRDADGCRNGTELNASSSIVVSRLKNGGSTWKNGGGPIAITSSTSLLPDPAVDVELPIVVDDVTPAAAAAAVVPGLAAGVVPIGPFESVGEEAPLNGLKNGGIVDAVIIVDAVEVNASHGHSPRQSIDKVSLYWLQQK